MQIKIIATSKREKTKTLSFDKQIFSDDREMKKKKKIKQTNKIQEKKEKL